MNERLVRRILLGTSNSPRCAEDLAETFEIPLGVCEVILEFLERRGYVANVVTLTSAQGEDMRYYLRTEIKLREMYDELSPRTRELPLLQSP